MKSYFRPEIDAMAGYVPGEQPKMADLVKLNTNENPFSPSPEVEKTLKNFDCARLRRYPDPMADSFRDAVASFWGVKRSNVIAGNGSDDLLTMIFRAFTSPELPVAVLDPSYSLYPELAAMQNAPVIKIKLAEKTFDLPGDILAQAEKANLLMIVRPNAPTGTLFPKETVRNICEKFDGIVVIDEAYADFAADNCIDFAREMDNVIVIRTQALGEAAFCDHAYFTARRNEVIQMRKYLAEELAKRGFYVPESESNFLFVSPPDGNGKKLFEELRKRAVIVRYFSAPATEAYLRITIGNPQENARLLSAIDEIYS